MQDKLEALLAAKKIEKHEYDTYLLFHLSELGNSYLKYRVLSMMMEEPPMPTADLFTWHDGRRSVFRDILKIIDFVNQQLQEVKND
jgi:hypothetical protein